MCAYKLLFGFSILSEDVGNLLRYSLTKGDNLVHFNPAFDPLVKKVRSFAETPTNILADSSFARESTTAEGTLTLGMVGTPLCDTQGTLGWIPGRITLPSFLRAGIKTSRGVCSVIGNSRGSV